VSRDPYWNHNTHYHSWLLAQVPPTAQTALDVGCGDGLLANKLAQQCDSVLGIDIDADVLIRARGPANVRFERADFRTLSGRFDFVSVVASVHHVPLPQGLTALRDLVAPGGTLVILGLWKMSVRTDPMHTVLIPVIRAVDAVHPAATDPAPVQSPQDTLADIRRAAAHILTYARIRRRLMWRYTLLWHKPTE
jgi:SAM-dependent methyltransferase